jgi:predicted nucleic acid-binding protein
MKVFLDSCIVIYLIEGTMLQRAVLNQVLEAAERPLALSQLARMECLVKPVRDRDKSLVDLYETFFALPELQFLDVTRQTVDLATSLRAKYNVKTPDALQLASAVCGGCDLFLTGDKGFDCGVKEIVVKVIEV